MTDTVMRGGLLADGTGSPVRRADVRVADGRIVEVAPALRSDGANVVDLDGLVLAPGVIDMHTHYDAQVLWDHGPAPSVWHGVTTIAMGNCGFGIAPAKATDHDLLIETLEKVEGMSPAALRTGIRWDFETFAEYLDLVESIPRQANVTTLVGHTPVRINVMGADAWDREATPAEIDAMKLVVLEALQAGARGFSTSRALSQNGAGGKPVPSRQASVEEVFALAGVVGARGKGYLAVNPGPGFWVEEFARLASETGRPVTWAGLLTGSDYEAMTAKQGATFTQTGEWSAAQSRAIMDHIRSFSDDVWSQVSCRPLVAQVTLAEPFLLSSLPSFRDVLVEPPERRANVYSNQAWRARARTETEHAWGARWPKLTVDETTVHAAIRGRSIAELAAERGVHPFDVMVDLALEESLTTRFKLIFGNDEDDAVAALVADDRAVIALSDAGAHSDMLCDAAYPSTLLGHWVRERQVLTLEKAVWKLTGQIAGLLGLDNRGRVLEGMAADLIAFDPDRIAAADPVRTWDLPGGADRLVADSVGLEHVWVAGTATRLDGKIIDDARPGRLLRA